MDYGCGRRDRLRVGLARALDQGLEAALQRAGLDAAADVAIRRLEADINPDAGEAQWATAILRALETRLQGGGDDATVMVFPSRIDSGQSALQLRARGAATPWWWRSLVGDARAGRLAGRWPAEEIVSEWIALDPSRAPAAVLELAAEGGGALDLFGPGAGPRLQDALLRAHQARRVALGAAEIGADLSRSAARRLSELAAGLLGGLPPTTLAALRLASAELGELLGACVIATRAPTHLLTPSLPDVVRRAAQGAWALAPARSERAAPVPDAAMPAPNGALSTTSRVGLDLPRSDAFEAEHAPTSATGAPQRPVAGAPTTGIPVGLGGLLFLLRWAVREPHFREPGAPTTERLAALAEAVLERLLAPLSNAARAQVQREHAPLLHAFSGLEPSSAARPDDETWAAIDRLRAAVPAGIEARQDALAWLYRDVDDPLAALAPEDRALAALVVRPGRLRVAAHRVDLFLSARLVDPALRAVGWDIDPGWFPWTGRIIRFHYVEDA